MNSTSTITFELGRVVYWPIAPLRIAQIDELLRKNVRLLYRAGTGRLCRPLVSPERLAELQAENIAGPDPPLLPELSNPYGRAFVRASSKEFTLHQKLSNQSQCQENKPCQLQQSNQRQQLNQSRNRATGKSNRIPGHKPPPHHLLKKST